MTEPPSSLTDAVCAAVAKRFKLDPADEGQDQEWFSPEFDDSDWAPIAIEQAWQEAGYDYIGAAWYRRVFTLSGPPRGL